MNLVNREVLKKPKWHAFLAVAFQSDHKGGYTSAHVHGKIKGHKGRGVRTIIQSFSTVEDFEKFILSLKQYSYNGQPCKLVFYNLNHNQWFLENLKKTAQYRPDTGVYRFDLINGLESIDIANYTRLILPQSAEIQAKVIFEMAEYLQDTCIELGVTMYRTPASTGFVLLKSKIPQALARHDSGFWNEYESNAYYGGRVECYRTGTHIVQSYDVIGMYLSIMQTATLPYPNYSKTYTDNLPDWTSLDYAIINCTVHVPDAYIPVLPHRVNHQLIFPVGIFTGSWTNIELHRAISHGATIIKIHSLSHYPTSGQYLKPFADLIASKRDKHPWLKSMGNAIYGKFGQKAYTDSTYTKLDDYEGSIDELADHKLTQIDGEDWLHSTGKFIGYYPHSFVCISAFITSYARLKLLDAILPNSDSIVYTDTDCIKITQNPINLNIGTSIGDWKLDHDFQEITIYGAKDYLMPEEHVIAGVPKTAKLIDEEGRVYRFNRPLGYREGINAGLIPNTDVEKEVTIHEKDTKRDHIGEGFSLPIHLKGE